MYQKEMQANNISTTLEPHISYEQLSVDEVLADSSRVSQILINLLSNAIKFVKAESERHIQIKYDACKSDPRNLFPKDIH